MQELQQNIGLSFKLVENQDTYWTNTNLAYVILSAMVSKLYQKIHSAQNLAAVTINR
jgi:hypothetical protein